jgi:hypothetical protein
VYWRAFMPADRLQVTYVEASMKFMATWSIREDKWLPILKLWVSMTPQQRADGGDGVRILGRWHDVAARGGVVILEATDLAAALRYAGQWNPHMDLRLVPVLDDEETAVVAGQILKANNA